MLGDVSVPSLIRANGCFADSRKKVASPNADDVLREWHAQIQMLRSLDIQITYLESHHHVHDLPGVFPVFCEIAQHYSLPARPLDAAMTAHFCKLGIPCADQSLLDWYGGDRSVQSLLSMIEQGAARHAGSCLLEVMCHPGLLDDHLPTVSRYVADRSRELEVLQNPDLLEAHAQRACYPVRFSSVEWRVHGPEPLHV
ncbi:MAG TPA: ChbG/HpnK family deacetylase [Terriglobia bacterium]|nr:ChbG/HpnK family deacetylase [Terriglobia bacterium]